MKSKTKSKMVSLRMTEEQFLYLEMMASRIKSTTGFHITRASIIIKLMEYGYPKLNAEFPPSPEDQDSTNQD